MALAIALHEIRANLLELFQQVIHRHIPAQVLIRCVGVDIKMQAKENPVMPIAHAIIPFFSLCKKGTACKKRFPHCFA